MLWRIISYSVLLNPYFLEGTNLPYHIVGAMELNDAANEVYRYNFPDDNLLQKNIEV